MKSGLILIIIGATFLLPRIGRIFPDFMGGLPENIHDYWPVILIFIGVLFLFKKISCPTGCKSKKRNYERNNASNTSDFIEKSLLFGDSEITMFSDAFKGGDANVAFGKLVVDLRKVTGVDANNFLEVNTMFGSAIIYIPSDWEVNQKSNTIFGSVMDKRLASDKIATPSVIITVECNALFGNIEIRN